MSRRRRIPIQWRALAADIGPDDGGDPREFHEKPWNQPRRPTRKAMQFSEQVLEALSVILSGLGDETLQNLTVVKVEPAPNTGRLRVTVAGVHPADATDPTIRNQVECSLGRAAGLIRSEVARAIYRKQTPELVFHLV